MRYVILSPELVMAEHKGPWFVSYGKVRLASLINCPGGKASWQDYTWLARLDKIFFDFPVIWNVAATFTAAGHWYILSETKAIHIAT